MWSPCYLALLLLCLLESSTSSKPCPPGFKAAEDTAECVQLTDRDVLSSLHWLASPPKVPASQACKNIKTVQGVDVCQDLLPASLSDCVMWSVIVSVGCNHYGSLEFEKFWAGKGCKVTLYTFSSQTVDCEYSTKSGTSVGEVDVPGHPNLTIQVRRPSVRHACHVLCYVPCTS